MSIRDRSLLLFVRRTDGLIGPISITPAESHLHPLFSFFSLPPNCTAFCAVSENESNESRNVSRNLSLKIVARNFNLSNEFWNKELSFKIFYQICLIKLPRQRIQLKIKLPPTTRFITLIIQSSRANISKGCCIPNKEDHIVFCV
jgi:hypothetical protein